MNKYLIKLKGRAKWLVLSGSLAMSLPLIAIACGESANENNSEVTPTAFNARNFLKDTVSLALVPTSESTPSNVVWPEVPPLPSGESANYEPLRFSTINYKDEASALADQANDNWKVDLPKTFDSVATQRFLWARLVHRTDKDKSAAFELTSSSGVQRLQASFSPLAFLENVVAKASVATDTSRVSRVNWVAAAPVLPASESSKYKPVEYSTQAYADKSAAALDKDEAHWSVARPSGVDSISARRALWARLVSIPTASAPGVTAFYDLTTLSGIKFVKADDAIVTDQDRATEFLKVQVRSDAVVSPGSTTTSITWKAASSLPSTLTSSYKVPVYSTQPYTEATALADQASTVSWKPELPKQVSDEVAQRHLWVLLQHQTDPKFSVVLDLSQSSGIEGLSVPVVVDPGSPATNAVLFLQNTLAPAIKANPDSLPGAVTWAQTTFPSLPTNLANNYEAPEFAVGVYFDNPSLAANDATPNRWTSALPVKVSENSVKRFLWVRLKSKNSTITSTAVDLSSSSELVKLRESVSYVAGAASDFLHSLTYVDEPNRKLSVNSADSVSYDVKWNPYDLALPDSLVDYYTLQFTNGTATFANPEAALSDRTDSNWPLSAPPTNVESNAWITDASKRQLWARLKPIDAKYSYAVYNLSDSTGISAVKVETTASVIFDTPITGLVAVVKANEDSRAENLKWTSYSWTPTTPGYEAFKAPQYSTQVYTDQKAALDDTDDSHWSFNLPATTLADAQAASRQLWVRLVHNKLTERSGARELSVTSQIREVLNSVEPREYLSTIVKPLVRVNENSKPSDVTWTAASTITLPRTYQFSSFEPLEYLTSYFPGDKSAAVDIFGDWKKTLPTTVDLNNDARHLWVRMRNKSDPNFSLALNITEDSGIKKLIDVDKYLELIVKPNIEIDRSQSFLDSIVYSKTPAALPQAYLDKFNPLEYTFGDASLASTIWSTTLPTSNYVAANGLSVRLVSKNGPVTQIKVFSGELNFPASVNFGVDYFDALTAKFKFATTPSQKTFVKSLRIDESMGALPTTPSGLSDFYYALEYSSYVGFNSPEDAIKDTEATRWQASYPTSGDLRPDSRALWIRLRTKLPSRLSTLVKNVTESSGLKDLVAIKGDYDQVLSPYLDRLSLSIKVAPNSTPANLSFSYPAGLLTIPDELAPFYDSPKFSTFKSGNVSDFKSLTEIKSVSVSRADRALWMLLRSRGTVDFLTSLNYDYTNSSNIVFFDAA